MGWCFSSSELGGSSCCGHLPALWDKVEQRAQLQCLKVRFGNSPTHGTWEICTPKRSASHNKNMDQRIGYTPGYSRTLSF